MSKYAKNNFYTTLSFGYNIVPKSQAYNTDCVWMHADRSEYKYIYCKKRIHIISNLTINAGSKELRVVPIDHTTLG